MRIRRKLPKVWGGHDLVQYVFTSNLSLPMGKHTLTSYSYCIVAPPNTCIAG